MAEGLQGQQEHATQAFLSDLSLNLLEQNTLKLSSLFKWYREDFEKGWHRASTHGQFLVLYRQSLGLSAETASQLTAGKISIESLDYDWRLNALTGPQQKPTCPAENPRCQHD